MQRWLLFFVIALICVSINPEESLMADNSPSSERNRALSLDGYGDYVEIADSERLNNIGSQVTMEAWIKPTAFPNDWIFIIYKGDKRVTDCSNRSYVMALNSAGFIELTSAPEGKGETIIESPKGIIELNKWYHIAGVVDSKSHTMRIFINGSEVAVGSFAGKIHKSALPLRIGWSHEEEIQKTGHSPFGGLIDEVRIWSIARTQAEIQKTMHIKLSGNEPGLAGYWRFDEKAVTDSSPGHSDGKFMGYAHLVEAKISAPETETRTGTEGVWKTYRYVDGLASNTVRAIMQDKEGAIWFGTYDGVSRFDGVNWKTYTQENGLTANQVFVIMQDKEGAIWFGTGDGVSRFDGKSWKTYLAGNGVNAIMQDKKGVIWFGKNGDGVSRFDGKSWKKYTKKDGLASNNVSAIMQDKEGVIWVGGDGVSQFDGKSWKTYAQKHGLAGNWVNAIMQDKEGAIWFGGDGVRRFDGKSWKTYTQKDGLAKDNVIAIIQDKEGSLWFGTDGGGVSRFDGRCFQTIDSRDGLVSDDIFCVYMDKSGQIWLGTGGGVVQFTPNKVSPPVYITQMVADETYDNPKGTIQLRSGIPRISISYHAISFKTRPGAMKYFYQLIGKDNDWQGTTNEETVEYFNLKPGKYTFKVQAVDRDLNYSEPASIEIKILSPPFYTGIWFIIGSIMTAFFIPSVIYGGLLLRQKKQTFVPIPNPYIVGNPIRSKEMFFGREDDFQFIYNKLAGSPTGLIIVLAGERRSGKTSIIYQILNGRLGERFVPVLIDMQAMIINNAGEFFEYIAQEINRVLIQTSLPSASIENYDFKSALNPAQVFQHYIDDIMANIGEHTLLYLIDEYELLEEKVESGVLTGESIVFLASLLERHSRITLLFTGSRHLEDRTAPYWRVLLPKSIPRYISFLSEQDTYRLITEPVKGQVKYARNVPEAIYQLTAGQPFYTQVVCQNLIDQLNMEERNMAELKDVSAVTKLLDENPLPQMLYFWDSFTKEQQVALSMLAELQEQPTQSIQVSDIIRSVKELGLSISFTEADWRGIFESLCRREIIQRASDKGEYKFRMDLFRPWIRHQHSIWEERHGT